TRSITFHSAAVRSITLSTVSTLLTVFGDLATIADFSCCTSSVVIASRRLSPNSGNRCTRIATSFDDTPLGFKRFAFAYRSRNRGANSRSVGVFRDRQQATRHDRLPGHDARGDLTLC